MRAVALGQDGRLQVVDREEPVAGPGEVIVAVERCGICGSDLHLRTSGLLPVGAVMGHEFAGTVVDTEMADSPDSGPSDGAGPRAGQRVAVLPTRRCGSCDACRRGKEQLCAAQFSSAIGLGLNDGAYAEYVRVPATSCHVLPGHMSPEQGALVEPYAVALHALGRSRVADGAAGAVGVIGAGPIGLMCLAALVGAGSGSVVVAEPNRRRATAAEAMGAAVVEDASRLGQAAAEPLEVVFDAAGSGDTPALAVQTVRPGGQVVLVGTPPPGQAVPMPGLLWVVKEVDVLPSIAYTDREFAAALAGVAAGALDTDVLAPDVRPLDAAQRSFEELSGPEAPVKVMLAPP